MVHYKLIYFDGRGAGEVIRHLFVVAGQEFEDVRISFEDWPKVKSEMPFGQVPVLEVDGKQLAQSYAIARYLARIFGIAGNTPFEEALVDSICDQLRDFLSKILPFLRVLTGFKPGDLEAMGKEIFLPAQQKFYTFMTKILNNNKSGFLVGDSLTWIDLYLAECSSQIFTYFPELSDRFPEMKSHAEKVHSIPALKKWIENRPRSNF